MKEAARRATEADLPTLAAFACAALQEMVALKPAYADLDARPEPVEESLLRDLSDPDAVVLVGTVDDAPVGYAVAHMRPRLPQAGGQHAEVTDIWVDSQARAIGIGEELIAAVLGWAAERGASSAEIRVLPGHRDAKNFCEENGFTARLLIMHKNIV